MNTFNRYQASEYNTCVSRCRTAAQWQDFMQKDNLDALPNLRWLPSHSASPREQHIPFYNRVWSKKDPFWSQNQPGSLWNCKCDWEQTDDPVTNNPSFPSRSAQGLQGNPASTGEVFSQDASYFKVGNKKQAEYDCQSAQRNYMQKTAKQYADKTATATINDKSVTVNLSQWDVRESAQSMFGSKYFWLKNEILKNFDFFLRKAKYIGSKDVDLTHNTGKTLRRKKQLEKYHYFNIKVGDTDFCMQVVQDKKGNYFLYTITKNAPI